MRGMAKGELFALDDDWYSQFADRLMPVGDDNPALHKEIQSEVKRQMETRTSSISKFHYIAETHGFKGENRDQLENEIVNAINQNGVKSYADKIFEREKIKWVLVDHSFLTTEPFSKMDDFPDGKKKWTYPIAPILQPDWRKGRKLTSASDVADDAKRILAQARKNGASGIKSTQAYFRDFDLTDVSEDQAEEALKTLDRIKPYTYFENAVLFPVYKEAEAIRALKVYQDYLLRNIFMEAGKQNLVTVIHTAVAVHPALKPWLNDPVKLYSIFDNDDVRRAGTKF